MGLLVWDFLLVCDSGRWWCPLALLRLLNGFHLLHAYAMSNSLSRHFLLRLFYVFLFLVLQVNCMVRMSNSTFWFFVKTGSVVQLKAISGALNADENLSSFTLEKISLLQQILVYVVSIIFSFIDLNSNVYENTWLYNNTTGFDLRADPSRNDSSSSSLKVSSEIKINWHQKAIVSVMEAGGLNWLVGKVGNF